MGQVTGSGGTGITNDQAEAIEFADTASRTNTFCTQNELGLERVPATNETMARLHATVNLSTSSGDLYLTYFTAYRSMPVTSISFVTGDTAAAATPTLVRFGLYSIDEIGDLALETACASDTDLLDATDTEYTAVVTTEYEVDAGTRYAAGLLIVTEEAEPSIRGIGPAAPETSPRLTGLVTAQTDLPAAIVAEDDIDPSAKFMYARIN